MRLLILGGDGMLGHQLLRSLSPHHDCRATLRRDLSAYRRWQLFNRANAYDQVAAQDTERLRDVIRDYRPDAVINAIGIVKQRASAHEVVPSLEINALLPHRLALLAKGAGARLLHFSTDCVFSGRKGNYTEQDETDATDLYGRSKLLGEVDDERCLTLRSSIIGRELSNKTSLVEWFLAQRGLVHGFTRAIYTGFTTLEMARIVNHLLTAHPDASGVWHVSSERIDKHALLCLLKEHFHRSVEIKPDDGFICDRSLDSSAFRRRFGYAPPSWTTMIAELAADRKFHDEQAG